MAKAGWGPFLFIFLGSSLGGWGYIYLLFKREPVRSQRVSGWHVRLFFLSGSFGPDRGIFIGFCLIIITGLSTFFKLELAFSVALFDLALAFTQGAFTLIFFSGLIQTSGWSSSIIRGGFQFTLYSCIPFALENGSTLHFRCFTYRIEGSILCIIIHPKGVNMPLPIPL